MPKNKGKGGKNRRRGKNENDGIKRELDLKEEGQEYKTVSKNISANISASKETIYRITHIFLKKIIIISGNS